MRLFPRPLACLALPLLLLAATGVARAAMGPDPEIGKPAPAFELKGSDDKTHKLSDFKGKVVVIHFQSNQCPWDRGYQSLISNVATKFAKGGEGKKDVVVIGINANKAEAMDAVKATIAKDKIPYVILKDPGNKVADSYAAKTTPHMYIIDGDGVLRYRGGVESPGKGPEDAGKGEPWLVPAVEAIASGKAPKEAVTKAFGCSIKRE